MLQRLVVVQPLQLLVYDYPHDLIGALKDAVHTQVTTVALNRVILHSSGSGDETSLSICLTRCCLTGKVKSDIACDPAVDRRCYHHHMIGDNHL